MDQDLPPLLQLVLLGRPAHTTQESYTAIPYFQHQFPQCPYFRLLAILHTRD